MASSTLLGCPREVRDLILEEAIDGAAFICRGGRLFHPGDNAATNGIFTTNKQLRAEDYDVRIRKVPRTTQIFRYSRELMLTIKRLRAAITSKFKAIILRFDILDLYMFLTDGPINGKWRDSCESTGLVEKLPGLCNLTIHFEMPVSDHPLSRLGCLKSVADQLLTWAIVGIHYGTKGQKVTVMASGDVLPETEQLTLLKSQIFHETGPTWEWHQLDSPDHPGVDQIVDRPSFGGIRLPSLTFWASSHRECNQEVEWIPIYND